MARQTQYVSTWPKYSIPSPLHSHQGPFPPTYGLATSTLRPAFRSPRSLRASVPRAPGPHLLSGCGLGCGLGPGRGPGQRRRSFSGRRKGGRVARLRRVRNPGPRWRWQPTSRLTQQRRRPNAAAKCGRHRRLTTRSPPARARIAAPLGPLAPTPAPHLQRLRGVRSGEDSDAGPGKAARKVAAVYFQGPCLRHTRVCTRPNTPLRTALLRLAHAANQRSGLGSPIRAARWVGRGGPLPERGFYRRASRAARGTWKLGPRLGSSLSRLFVAPPEAGWGVWVSGPR